MHIQRAGAFIDPVSLQAHGSVDPDISDYMQNSLNETHKRQLDHDSPNAPPSKKHKVSETHMVIVGSGISS